MSTGYGYTHPNVTGDDLRRLVTTVCGAPTYLYTQAIDAVGLALLKAGEPTLTPEGRAFGPEAEVRWQRHDDGADGYIVLVLSEAALDLGSDWQEETFEVSDPLTVYLMGVWQPKERAWIEVRVPHPLDYPLPDPGRMARPVAPAVEYSQDGIVRYIRFKGLKAEPLEEAG
ncbi:MAG: hypothetical protein DRI79_14340 [Chloroflexi bacterium]|nr:MAG: hypothetical protein DRI79_14340 [Chloroflexota bacterium]